MELDIVALVLTVLCIFAIAGVTIYIYKQLEETKDFVKKELKKFAASVNDAQYNEYTHDEKMRSNIKIMNDKLTSMEKRFTDLETRVKDD